MVLNGTVTDYDGDDMPSYRIETNCYHIVIKTRDGKTVVFSRTKPFTDEWLDGKHIPITIALQQLETAILDAIKP